MTADLEGQIERITYTNEENGFTIARLKVYGRPDLVTVVGNLMAPTPGEILKLKGEWTNHPKYGEQFKIVHLQDDSASLGLWHTKILRFRTYQGYRACYGKKDRKNIR